MATELRNLVLDGEHVRLEPLNARHARDLYEIGRNPGIWTYMPRGPLASLEDARVMIEQALADADNGSQAPFAVVAKDSGHGLPAQDVTGKMPVPPCSGRAAGSTRYLDIRPKDRALEIGWTWLGAEYQRTAVNTECKYLLLRHAFEALGAVRVQLRTDARNERSQRAIERIGAVREGVLRRNWMMWNGFIRDTVYYGMLDDEWPAAKARLEQMLNREKKGSGALAP